MKEGDLAIGVCDLLPPAALQLLLAFLAPRLLVMLLRLLPIQVP